MQVTLFLLDHLQNTSLTKLHFQEVNIYCPRVKTDFAFQCCAYKHKLMEEAQSTKLGRK